MTQEEFNAMLQIAIAQGLPGGNYTSKYSRGEDIDAALDGGMRAAGISVPSKSVTLAASELQDYLDGLPRLLTESISISLTGTYAGDLSIESFYGAGSIHIGGSRSPEIQGKIVISNCFSRISIYHVKVSARNDMSGINLITVEHSATAIFNDVEFSGNGAGGNVVGIRAQNGGSAMLIASTMHDLTTAVMASGPSIISAQDISADNNVNGASAYRGGIIMLFGSTPNALGGGANLKNGGIIISKTGDLL